ncbi:cation transporter [Bacteroidales bacterium]|nr:cation transporter [Bacteroidales bacterium]
MIKFLINRPIAVFMAFTAFFILGIITYFNVPVSLLPDIAIPEITVQIAGKNTSARELESTVVAPMRQQLLQIGKLRDISTETRDGNALIRLSFEYGANTDLAFIEVNEKIDAAMNYIPREVQRPQVVKASASDIPVLKLNITLKNEGENASQSIGYSDFIELSEFAQTLIKRRLEQLPQVAMVDMTGLLNKQVLIIPDNNQLEISGISLSDIESVLKNNNIEPGSMVVRDGYYEYNIKFSSVLRSIEDIENIYIRKNDKIIQLKDLAKVSINAEKEKGMAFFNGKRAITLAIIKQGEENMANMQAALDEVIMHFRDSYPDISFDVSQNQTELLDHSISNLQENLLLAFLFVCLVSVLFLRDIKSPIIIGISVFVSLVITLLFFYLFQISLNVVSLTGLILALGMMIDNSIIVTDNIGQYRKVGLSVDEACIKGTNEVIAPMLSSVMTTISVFVPLVFLSGIAGAIFFDQAFSVAIGLLVSYITGIILLPVLYKLVYSFKKPHFIDVLLQLFPNKYKSHRSDKNNTAQLSLDERIYNCGVEWIFRHKVLTFVVMLAVFPLCFWLFTVIDKKKMPDISQNELLVQIDWNENIHVDENKDRVNFFVNSIKAYSVEHSALVGQQQYLLNREREQTSSEAEVYIKTAKVESIPQLKTEIEKYFLDNYPDALVAFLPAATIFEKIFATGAPDLRIEYYTKNRSEAPSVQEIRQLEKQMAEQTGENPSNIAFQKQLNIHINSEKLLLYRVDYQEVYQALRTGFKENEFSTLRSYQQYLPIILGTGDRSVQEVIDMTLIHTLSDERGIKMRIPLNVFVSITPAEDLKTIVAGKNGEYIPIEFNDTQRAEQIIEVAQENIKNQSFWDINISGNFFSDKEMIGELLVILFISILLMYFILAAQFESFVQPFIVLLEIPIDIAASLGLLMLMGHSLNLMSAIGIVVTCGIIINDSILKVDIINKLRKDGMPLMDAIHEGGRRRLKAILMTSMTSIVCMLPIILSNDMGSELEKPLAIATVGGMLIGTPVSLFVVPLVYWWIYRNKL